MSSLPQPTGSATKRASTEKKDDPTGPTKKKITKGKRGKNPAPQKKPKKQSTPGIPEDKPLAKYAETSPDTDVAHKSEDSSMPDVATEQQNIATDTADTGTEPEPVERARSSSPAVAALENAKAVVDSELEHLLRELKEKPPTPDKFVVQIADASQYEDRFEINIPFLVSPDVAPFGQLQPVPGPSSLPVPGPFSLPVLLEPDVPEAAVLAQTDKREEARLADLETENPAPPEVNKPAE